MGPYRVYTKLSEVNYEIQHIGNNPRKIVHFDRLKQCQKDIRIHSDKDSCMVPWPVVPNTRHPPGSALQLVDDDDAHNNIQRPFGNQINDRLRGAHRPIRLEDQ